MLAVVGAGYHAHRVSKVFVLRLGSARLSVRKSSEAARSEWGKAGDPDGSWR